MSDAASPRPFDLFLARFRLTARTSSERAGQLAATHSRALLAAIFAIYALAQLDYSLATPLWHDELFTFYIAQAPSLRAMFGEIHRVDLNPPLSYLLTKLSFALFGVGTLQCRLPEIAGFALAMACIFRFVERRAGGVWGLLAASLLFASRAGELVTQARPYGLMLGFSALALVCWQAAFLPDARRQRPATVALFAALAALLLTHVFGLLAWAALTAAEVIQTLQSRRLNIPRTLALSLPLSVTLLYRPLLSNHAQSAFPLSFQPSGSDIFIFYMGHVDRELITFGLSALPLLLLGGRRWLRPTAGFVLTVPEWVVTGGLLMAPFLLIGYLMVTHGAFFDRYGVIVCLGTAVLFAILFQWWTSARPVAALIAACMALLITGRMPDAISAAARGQIFRHTEPVITPLDTSLLRNRSLPLVTASGLTFVELQRRESASLTQRTFFLTDLSSALQYAHATIFEGMPEEAALFDLHGHVTPYRTFLAAHPNFYVLGTYDYPEDWLLRKLQHDGATIQVLGRMQGSYKDHELYEVHVAP